MEALKTRRGFLRSRFVHKGDRSETDRGSVTSLKEPMDENKGSFRVESC